MIRDLEYRIITNENSILDFLKKEGYSSNVIVHLKKTPENIQKNGVWSYVREPLHPGDHLTIHLEESTGSANIIPEKMKLDILYEDADILVLNKPADLPIHPSVNHYEHTLANGIAWYFADRQIPYTFRCITRLDRDTTGITLLAKHMLSAAVLSREMQARQIRKEYLALCSGTVPRQGCINAPISRATGSVIERCVDFQNGEPAQTDYFREQTDGQISLVRIHPKTGRTHQIRVHMKHIGHPLLGDFLYHPEDSSMERQALHCAALTLTHPITKEIMTFRAELPPDMQQVLHASGLLF